MSHRRDSLTSTPSPRFSFSLSRPLTPTRDSSSNNQSNQQQYETTIESACHMFIDTLRSMHITTIVLDLDRTLTSIHSQGACDASSLSDYCLSLTSTSRILLPLLIQSGFIICIATFSDELYTSNSAMFPYYSRESYISGRQLVQAVLKQALQHHIIQSHITIICINPELYSISTPTQSRIMPTLPRQITKLIRGEPSISNDHTIQQWSPKSDHIRIQQRNDYSTNQSINQHNDIQTMSINANLQSIPRAISSSGASQHINRRHDHGWISTLCCCFTSIYDDDDRAPPISSSSFVTPMHEAMQASPAYQPPPMRNIPIVTDAISHPSLSIPNPTPSPRSVSVSHSIPPAVNLSLNQSISPSVNPSNNIRDSEGLVVTVNDVSMILEGEDEMELGMYQIQASPSRRNLPQLSNLSTNNPSANLTALSPSTSPILSNPLSLNGRINNNNSTQFTQSSPRHHLSHRSMSGHLNPSKSTNVQSPLQSTAVTSPLNSSSIYPRSTSPVAPSRPLPLPPLQVHTSGTFTTPSTPSSHSAHPSQSQSQRPPIGVITPKTVPTSKMSKHFFPTTPKLLMTSRHSPANMSHHVSTLPSHNHSTLTQPLPPFAQLVAAAALAAPHSTSQPNIHHLSNTPSGSQSAILNIDKPLDQSSKHAFFINKLHALGLNQFHSLWSTVSQYPPPSYKTTHLHCVRALHAVTMQQIILIDDMEDNVNAAVSIGCHALHVSGNTGLRPNHLQSDRIISPFTRSD